MVGSRYLVQWENARQVTQAVVLATGSHDDMKARETDEEQNPSVAFGAPAASTKPPAKRRRVKKNKKGKELARMLAVGQGQVAAPIGPVGAPEPVALTATVSLEAPATFAPTMSLEIPAAVAPSAFSVTESAPIVPAPTTPSGPSVEVPAAVAPAVSLEVPAAVAPSAFPVTASAPIVPAPTTPSGPSVEVPSALTTPSVPVSLEVPGSTLSVRRPTIRFQRQSDDTVTILTVVQPLLVAQNRRFDAQAIMIQDLHRNVRDIRQHLDEAQALNRRAVSSEPSTVVDLSTLGLPEEEVRRIHRESHNAGHFACLLVKRVFPELFGPGNLRSLYNWHGGGQNKKLALEEPRRETVCNAVLAYHPDVRGVEPFQERVVIKVNEMLRRKERRPLARRELNTDTPLLDGFMSYMNSENM
ncbi:hypothetical protein DPMN_012385 [Dreissena polymorpha]|uniref:BEN domain-containing protein n=1 Tax=Dreissena polymorpha TaxID=45954 RepID=A0A9D4N2A5_DREPO|nr:hypothetical protein DPMN_012385 [Dreissena polymorpha]